MESLCRIGTSYVSGAGMTSRCVSRSSDAKAGVDLIRATKTVEHNPLINNRLHRFLRSCLSSAHFRWLFACRSPGMRSFPHDDGRVSRAKAATCWPLAWHSLGRGCLCGQVEARTNIEALPLFVLLVGASMQGCAGVGTGYLTLTPTSMPTPSESP
jgi:hypothetical protein